MKKWIALLLAALAVTALAACGSAEEKPAAPTEEPTTLPTAEPVSVSVDDPDDNLHLVGGWTMTDSPEVTDRLVALLDKATASVDDAAFEPVAYVASQVVAGTNHLILCKEKRPSAPAVSYALVRVFEDLQGNARILSVEESDVSADYPTDVDGGWGEASSPVITEEVKAAFDTTDESGVSYRPLSLLATQVVAGMNYRCLCCPASPGQINAPDYVIAEVYRSLEGDSSVTAVHSFTAE